MKPTITSKSIQNDFRINGKGCTGIQIGFKINLGETRGLVGFLLRAAPVSLGCQDGGPNLFTRGQKSIKKSTILFFWHCFYCRSEVDYGIFLLGFWEPS